MPGDADIARKTQRLGQYVQELRHAKGWSERRLASTARVDTSWLSRLERGVYESPDARALYRLAGALGIEPEELYLIAGYTDGHGLPGFAPYLRAKYELPDDAIAQLQDHFELIHERYQSRAEGLHGK